MLPFIIPIHFSAQKKYSSSHSAEADLVEGLVRKEQKALEILYSSYTPSLLGIISRIVKQDDVAEDVLQETFIKIWNSIGQYDASKGRLFTWMARLAKNKAIDHLRTRGEVNNMKNDVLDDSTVQVNRLYQVEYNPEFIGLKQLINVLTPVQTTVIDMVYFQGYTQSEVSQELNIPIGTVKTRISRAIKTMRAFF